MTATSAKPRHRATASEDADVTDVAEAPDPRAIPAAAVVVVAVAAVFVPYGSAVGDGARQTLAARQ